ncbi:hypothetical protein Tco_0735284 [Tanacetum coccineum]
MESLNSNSKGRELQLTQLLTKKPLNEKPLNEAIHHEHEIEKSFKLQSKDVQINSVQVMDANLVITKSGGIESKINSLENALSKSMNETQMQMQEGKVDIESSGTKSDEQDTSSRSRNDADTKDAVIRPVNDQEPLAEVQLTAQHNILANEQQYSEQSPFMTHICWKRLIEIPLLNQQI